MGPERVRKLELSACGWHRGAIALRIFKFNTPQQRGHYVQHGHSFASSSDDIIVKLRLQYVLILYNLHSITRWDSIGNMGPPSGHLVVLPLAVNMHESSRNFFKCVCAHVEAFPPPLLWTSDEEQARATWNGIRAQ
ncbi:hypothetical protein BV22DRAFT_938991 [Leucogyrophana mollusca]|uniref:Uncharacterized protein n=1 Tax=Leucogyrophana mollusca TaxID=85980 RepID=A0ACB8AUX0_9AGAM|nr:hypothetical protein BV22DRAFT_938991 [Leucogyrophana mollusca]